MHKVIKSLLAPYFKKYISMQQTLISLESAVEYFTKNPMWIESDTTGFNGQRIRKIIFQQIMENVHFDTIIETGTWMGDTGGYMAKTSSLPVYTCELNRHILLLAKLRLKGIQNITFSLNDSRVFLRAMAESDVSKKRTFFYLDAHWNADLPLKEELDIICSHWHEFVIMIDDFQVPDDSGYGYDNYGKEKELSLRCFSKTLKKLELLPFFPAKSSHEETGAKRGCVILAQNGVVKDILCTLQALRKENF